MERRGALRDGTSPFNGADDPLLRSPSPHQRTAAAVSAKFRRLAREHIELLPDGPELTVALRKLFKFKDAAVRHAVFNPEENQNV